MRVRKLDANGDMVFGGSQAAFYVDQAEAVGQIVYTRISLWLGQWYLNTADGTPWLTEILGKYTSDSRDPAIRKRILDAPGVLDIIGYNSQFESNNRSWHVAAGINTIFGPVTITGSGTPITNPYALLSVLGVTAGSGGGSGSGSGLMTLDMSNGLSPFLM